MLVIVFDFYYLIYYKILQLQPSYFQNIYNFLVIITKYQKHIIPGFFSNIEDEMTCTNYISSMSLSMNYWM